MHFSKQSIWEPVDNDCYHFSGTCSEEDWLTACSFIFLGQENSLKQSRMDSYSTTMLVGDAIHCLIGVAKEEDLEHVFLDSFSIIENGETACRRDRIIDPSPCQKALLHCVSRDPDSINRMTPREFEVLVAHTLKEIGFSKVTLRRYAKDSGIDILAVMASASHVDELVVVEVKHGRQGVTLSVIDRLNGVRDRVGANRALAVTSAHVTRDAKSNYSAHRDYVAVYTFNELTAILNDSDDWSRTPNGLWTKCLTKSKEKCRTRA